MDSHSPTTRYILYARKSSSSEDRQIQSIDDQIARLSEIARARGLSVVSTMYEAKSAKVPEQRPVFAQLLAAIEGGDADGILCWQLNRLSRNPIDSGRIAYLLQQGSIRSIVTAEREHLPDDNVLLFSLESGVANQFLVELSRNVKRGIRGKLERGELPGMAPVGYVNDRATKKIVRDPDRFHVLRRAWEMMITGAYTVADIGRWLDSTGFTTLRRSHSGGTPLAASALYRIFDNPFYMGVIRNGGNDYKGAHEPMVGPDEFLQVQAKLHRKTAPRPKRHFQFAQLFSCGECGCRITAERKTKLLKSTGTTTTYTYYHCGHHSRSRPCSQRAHVTEHALEAAIAKELRPLTLRKAFVDAALRRLARQAASQGQASIASERLQVANEIAQTRRELGTLTQLRYRDLIADDEFIEQRRLLADRLAGLESRYHQAPRVDTLLARLESIYRGLADLAERFLEADDADRRHLLARLCSNRVIVNKKPAFGGNDLLADVAHFTATHRVELERFELMKGGVIAAQKGAFAPLFQDWHTLVDDVWNHEVNCAPEESMFYKSEEAIRESLHDQDIVRRRDGRGGKRRTA